MKKFSFLALILSLVSLLAVAQPAFGAAGLFDTKASALIRPSGYESITLWLDHEDDVDWFKYVNTTGSGQFMSVYLAPPGGSSNFNLGVQYSYPNGNESTLFYAPDSGPGVYDVLEFLYVPAGATIYFKVECEPGAYDSENKIYELITITSS